MKKSKTNNRSSNVKEDNIFDFDRYFVDSKPLTDEEFQKKLFYTNESMSIEEVDFSCDEQDLEHYIDMVTK